MNKNLTLKQYVLRLIISLVLAILVWYSISGRSNNIITREITNIPVTVSNESSLKEKGLIINNNIQYYVNLEIRGTEASLDSIDEDDLVATINLADINSDGAQSLPVVIEGLNNSVILDQTTPSNIQIEVNEIKDKEFTPDIIAQGKPADNYSVVATKTSEKVKVDGPNDQIDKISRISGVVSVDGITQTSYQYVDLNAYDEDGNLIENITVNPKTVHVEVEIGITKQVQVDSPEITNLTTAEYEVTKTEVNPATVTIAGEQDVINATNSIKTAPISITDTKQDKTYSINTDLIVPDGISIVGNTSEVSVDVYIERINNKNINVSDINVNGLGSNLEVQKIDPGSLNVSVSGTSSKLSKVDSSNVKASIDVSGMGEGTYKVPVNINLEGVTVNTINPPTVSVVINKKA